jgi:hypothetical protein
MTRGDNLFLCFLVVGTSILLALSMADVRKLQKKLETLEQNFSILTEQTHNKKGEQDERQ